MLMKAMITQREMADLYGEKIDVLEGAYTTYFQRMGVTLIPVSNYCEEPAKYLDDAELLILTGGGDVPTRFYADGRTAQEQVNRDRVEELLLRDCLNRGIPVLAICRGFQFVNGVLGGKVRSLHSAGSAQEMRRDHPVQLCKQGRQIWVNHYHNDCVLVNELADCVEPIAVDESGVVEAFACSNGKLLALQWHPERAYEDPMHSKETNDLIREFITGGNAR